MPAIENVSAPILSQASQSSFTSEIVKNNESGHVFGKVVYLHQPDDLDDTPADYEVAQSLVSNTEEPVYASIDEFPELNTKLGANKQEHGFAKQLLARIYNAFDSIKETAKAIAYHLGFSSAQTPEQYTTANAGDNPIYDNHAGMSRSASMPLGNAGDNPVYDNKAGLNLPHSASMPSGLESIYEEVSDSIPVIQLRPYQDDSFEGYLILNGSDSGSLITEEALEDFEENFVIQNPLSDDVSDYEVPTMKNAELYETPVATKTDPVYMQTFGSYKGQELSDSQLEALKQAAKSHDYATLEQAIQEIGVTNDQNSESTDG